MTNRCPPPKNRTPHAPYRVHSRSTIRTVRRNRRQGLAVRGSWVMAFRRYSAIPPPRPRPPTRPIPRGIREVRLAPRSTGSVPLRNRDCRKRRYLFAEQNNASAELPVMIGAGIETFERIIQLSFKQVSAVECIDSSFICR